MFVDVVSFYVDSFCLHKLQTCGRLGRNGVESKRLKHCKTISKVIELGQVVDFL